MEGKVSIGITTYPKTEEEAFKVAEALSRMAIGFGLDGINASFSIFHDDEDGEDDLVIPFPVQSPPSGKEA